MRSFYRNFNYERQEYTVYTEEEASEEGLQYKHWSEAEEGEWGATDDGYVCQVVKKKGPYGNGKYYYTLSFMELWSNEKARFAPYADLEKPYQNWVDAEVKKTRARRTIKMFAQFLVVRDGDLNKADWEFLANMYRTDQKKPVASVKRLIKQDRVQEMIAKELAVLLEGMGVSKDKVVEMYLETYNMAKDMGHSATMKSVIDKFSDMLDMKPQKEQSEDLPMLQINWGMESDEYEQLPEPADEMSGEYLDYDIEDNSVT